MGGVRSTISTAELRLAQSRISVEEENRKSVNEKRTVAADSLQKFKLQILDLQNNADTVGELGPLQYLSGLTSTPMDKIINILLLIIIFVFDPLAISLVVAANFAFDKARPKENLYGEFEDDIEEDLWDDLDEEEVTEEEVLNELEVESEEVLPDEARGTTPPVVQKTGYQLENNIERVIHKRPSKWLIKLKTGEEIYVNKDVAQQYITGDPDNVINYL